MRISGLSLLTVLSLLLFSGCSTQVKCPSIPYGRNVALVDHGRHASLVLESEEGMIRYSFGDWKYYALAEQGFWSGVRALFWPTRSGLGRRELAKPVTDQNVRKRMTVLAEHIFIFQLETERVRRFIEAQDKIYYDHQTSRIYNAPYDLYFVHHPESYSLINNSNYKVGQWLEEMGCTTDGWSFLSNWKVK